MLKAPPNMYDGQWEVGVVLGNRFREEVMDSVEDEREQGVVEALIDATRASKEALTPNTSITTMDIWTGVFCPVG